MSKLLTNGLNLACSDIAASYITVGDDSMSVIRFQKTPKGELPNLSYIFRKPETLDTEFKTVVFSIPVSF